MWKQKRTVPNKRLQHISVRRGQDLARHFRANQKIQILLRLDREDYQQKDKKTYTAKKLLGCLYAFGGKVIKNTGRIQAFESGRTLA